MKNYKFAFAFALTFASTVASASEYNLFNPVPDDKLRAFTTERPSKTDSAFTVDSGHVVVETSLVNYSREKNNGTKTEGLTYGGLTTIRLGLTQSADVQVITDLYRQLRVTDELTGVVDKKDGYGDTVVRLKHNLIGNDGGDLAVAAIGFVKLPTNQNELGNDAVEYGANLPFNYNLAGGYSIGGMTQINALKDSDGEGYNAAFTNSLILGKSITEQLSTYVEVYTFRNTEENSEWLNTLDFGVGYAVTDNFRVDTGVNFGISDYADDLNFFVGTAYRF